MNVLSKWKLKMFEPQAIKLFPCFRYCISARADALGNHLRWRSPLAWRSLSLSSGEWYHFFPGHPVYTLQLILKGWLSTLAKLKNHKQAPQRFVRF
jgi:hypothetical protein